MLTSKQSIYNSKIFDLLKRKPHSIAELSRELNINRSTLRYYLNELKRSGWIVQKRQKNEAGQPTIISLNPSKIESMQLKEEQYEQEILKDIVVQEVLGLLNKPLLDKEIYEHFNQILKRQKRKDLEVSTRMRIESILWILNARGYITQKISITPKGQEYLKQIETQNDKTKNNENN